MEPEQMLDVVMRVGVTLATSVKLQASGGKALTPWQLNPGKQTWIFPEIRCPYCRRWFVSKGIWVTTERRLIGQMLVEDGKRLVLEEPRHPHADYSGSLCFGSAKTIQEALFGAIADEGVNVNSIRNFLLKFTGHDNADVKQCVGRVGWEAARMREWEEKQAAERRWECPECKLAQQNCCGTCHSCQNAKKGTFKLVTIKAKPLPKLELSAAEQAREIASGYVPLASLLEE